MAAARQADVAETLQPSSVKMGEMKKELVHFMQWMCITARRPKFYLILRCGFNCCSVHVFRFNCPSCIPAKVFRLASGCGASFGAKVCGQGYFNQ